MTRQEEIEKRLEEIRQEQILIDAEQNLRNYKSNLTRGRALTVGTAFGGTTEISMRGDGDAYLWILLQPVEVTELIHQLAGNIGCHINIKPRDDFASWRNWKADPMLGYADPANLPQPYSPEQIDTACEIGNKLPSPEQQPGHNYYDPQKEIRTQDEPLAIKKSTNKRKSKRTSSTP